MMMKRTGKLLTQLSHLMFQEFRLLWLPLLIVSILMLSFHLIGILRFNGVSIPYSILYYYEPWLYRGDLALTGIWLIILSIRYLPFGQNQQRMKRYELLPISRGMILIAQTISVVCALLAFQVLVFFCFIFGYVLAIQIHPNIHVYNGLYAAVSGASYMYLYFPQTIQAWLTAGSLLLSITVYISLGQRALRYPKKNIHYFFIAIIIIAVFACYLFYKFFAAPTYLYEQNQIIEFFDWLLSNQHYLMFEMLWITITCINSWYNVRSNRL